MVARWRSSTLSFRSSYKVINYNYHHVDALISFSTALSRWWLIKDWVFSSRVWTNFLEEESECLFSSLIIGSYWNLSQLLHLILKVKHGKTQFLSLKCIFSLQTHQEAKLPTKWLFISGSLFQSRLVSKVCLKKLVVEYTDIILKR